MSDSHHITKESVMDKGLVTSTTPHGNSVPANWKPVDLTPPSSVLGEHWMTFQRDVPHASNPFFLRTKISICDDERNDLSKRKRTTVTFTAGDEICN